MTLEKRMQQPVFKPIGIVRNEVKGPRRGGWEEVASEVVIEESLEECLEGLEEFSHILVIYWMHKVPPIQQPMGKIHPQGRADLPLVGLFATRTPYRPNPVGVRVARLVERKGNVLKVVGLDAIDGTPVLDIKPYLPPYDSPADFKVPDWVRRLR
jgi:tRNA-Thr(GGU) m(6)t(6)A37 methyltransferase TsaA